MSLAFVFPGQGSQSVGMLDAFAGNEAVASVLARADAALGEKLSTLIATGPAEALALTVNTQPAMLVASYARSVKEAQTYTQLIAFAGFLPSLFLSVLPIRPQEWMYLIPTIGQLYFITVMSRGLPLDTMQVALCSLLTAAIGAVALVAAMRLYNREQIILGKATA